MARESGPTDRDPSVRISEAMKTATSSPVQVEIEPEHADERALLERILASRHFVKSGLLSRFLRYICERSLTGGGHALTEHHIGVHVFGRPEGYDCSADNIVRNYARQLRNRLDDYYRWEGQSELLRLEVPRGGYKPIFLPLTMNRRPGAAEDHAALFTTPISRQTQRQIATIGGGCSLRGHHRSAECGARAPSVAPPAGVCCFVAHARVLGQRFSR